jgi:hypothetical protein
LKGTTLAIASNIFGGKFSSFTSPMSFAALFTQRSNAAIEIVEGTDAAVIVNRQYTSNSCDFDNSA